MTRRLAAAALILLASVTAFAHAGHHHKYLGTVTSIDGDRVAIRTTDEKDVTFVVTAETAYKRGDSDAKRADLGVGVRVAVEMATDGRTAAVVKLPK
jgi:hypothetical protein